MGKMKWYNAKMGKHLQKNIVVKTDRETFVSGQHVLVGTYGPRIHAVIEKEIPEQK